MKKYVLMYLRSFYICLAFIAWCGSSFAQQDYTAEIHLYTTAHGLPTNHVYQCFQDRRGVLWLLTASGLTRFDGRQFQLILQKGFNADHSKNYIWFEEPNGDLWISCSVGTDLVEYTIVNTLTGKISTPQQKFGKFLPANMLDVKYAGNNSFWITTTSGEVLKFQPGEPPVRIHHLPGEALKICAVDSIRQLIWLDIPNGPYGNRNRNYRLINSQGKTIGTYNIPFLQNSYLDKQGFLRYYTLKDLGFISPEGKLAREPIRQHLPDYNAQKEADYDLPLAFDPNFRNYWLIHDNQVAVFHRQKGQLFTSTNINSNQISPTNAFTIFTDRQGIAWFCTIEGLYKITLSPRRFKRLLWIDPNIAENPVLMSCRGILKDEDLGILYVNAGNCLWAIEDGAVRKIFGREIAIYALAQTANRDIWMGCEGLFKYPAAEKGAVKKILQIPRNFSIAWSFLLQDKRLWVGMNNGLAYVDAATEKFHFLEPHKSHPGLDNAIIHAIFKAKGQQLWLLTEKGLFLFDPQKGIIARYWTGGKGKFHLPAENLRACHRDENGIWWLATGEGLLRWDPTQNKSRLFTMVDGLSNNNIYAVYPDEYGFLWLSCDRGIIQFQKNTGKSRVFLPQDGLTHQEFNRTSHFQAKDGHIYFGSLNGVTVFHPREFHEDFHHIPNIPLILASANLFSKERNAPQDVELDYYQKGKILFKPSHLYLTLRFALLDYTAPQSIQYEYLIEGLGNTWAPCPGGMLQLAGLPYGQFKLVIRAKTIKGLYTREPLSIPIQVLRPYYLQLWFLALISLLVLGSMLGLFRFRNQWLKKRKVELEQEVALQTEKIREDKAIIEQQAAQLIKLDEAKSRFFANVTHELRTPLTLILGPISTVLESKTLDPRNQELLQMSRKHSEDLLETINDLLDLTKLEAGKLEPQERPTLLYRKIKLLLGAFIAHAERKGIVLQLDYRAEHYLNVQLDDRIFALIFNNLLSNALKFTEQGGKINLLVTDLAHSIQISVEDNGRGIHPDDLPHVFERFFQTHDAEAAYEGGTGIGLSLANESSKAMGGTLSVKSTWGQGSIFTLQFPKKELFGNIEMAEQEEIDGLLAEEIQGDVTRFSVVPALTEYAGEQPRILLVEDNHDLRQYLMQILEENFQILALGNGREAQLHIKEWRPDLILSDIMMPIMDGFQLLEWLKSTEEYADTPIIMLTARADLSDKLRALRTGVDDYLIKPFVEAELLARIQNLLHRQQKRRKQRSDANDIENNFNAKSEVEKVPMLTSADKQWLEELEATILKHLENPEFTVNDLAKTLLMSRSIFYIEVGRLIGLTPNEYINEIRLKKAFETLQSNPGIGIKVLSGLVGFRDEKYFSRLFKLRYGVLPSQMR